MFVLQNSDRKLSILNGGVLNRLEYKDINYYFNKMDEIILYIKNPLDQYTEYQKQISEAIKTIGGRGTIHGSIVDIAFFNHIFFWKIRF